MSLIGDLSRTPLLQVHGTLVPEALYVERAADQELLHALLAGDLCYVLAPRQIGKSSLQARARQRLRQRGVACASIDLTQLGSYDLGPEGWCRGLVQELADGFALGDPEPFWRQHQGLLPLHRFSRYLHDQVLPGLCTASAVVFIDEVEAVLGLPPYARDDFFASIRAFYNARADDPACARLTFCLCGVATAMELMRDAARTPFNIGREITLRDFNRREAEAFLPALAGLPDAAAWLDAVYEWTSGHPYMTQRLCAALQRCEPGQDPQQTVAALVDEHFLRRGRSQDANLAYAERRFFAPEQPRSQSNQMLQVYGALLREEKLPQRGGDAVQEALRLTGMTAEREEGGQVLLCVRNRVFAAVFGAAWVGEREGECYFGEALGAWQRGQRRPDYLLRGAALQQALAWAEGRTDLSDEEHRFLRASQVAEQAAEQRRRRGLTVLGALVVVIAVLLGRAFWETRRFRQQDQWSYRGFRAASLARQGARELEALSEGVLAVAPALQASADVPRQAAEGLALAVTATRRSLPLVGHSKSITGVYFSPNSKRLLSISLDHTARLWDPDDGRLIRVLSESNEFLYAAAFAPDSRRFCTGGNEGVVRCYDAGDGRLLRARQVPFPPNQLAYAPDGRSLLAASGAGATATTGHSDERAILLLGAEGLEQQTALRGHSWAISALLVTPDGRRALGISHDEARLWDLQRRTVIAVRKPYQGKLVVGALAPDGQVAAMAGDDGQIYLFTTSDGAALPTLRGHEAPVSSLAFHPRGGQLLSTGLDGTARLWSLSGDNAPISLTRHAGALQLGVYASDGGQVATAAPDGSVWLYETATGETVARLQGHAGGLSALAFSPDGRRIVTAGVDGSLRLWSAQTGRFQNVLSGHRDEVLGARFSPDGRRIASAGSSYLTRLWDGQSGVPIADLPGRLVNYEGRYFLPGGELRTQDKAERAWLFHEGAQPPLRSFLAGPLKPASPPAPCAPRCVRLYLHRGADELLFFGLQQSTPLFALRAPQVNGRATFVSVAPSGRRVVLGGRLPEPLLFDGEDGHLITSLPGHQGAVSPAVFSHDELIFATPGDDKTIRLWSARSGAHLRTIIGHSDEVHVVAFSPDDQQIASVGRDRSARVSAVATGAVRQVLFGHGAATNAVGFSPDGARLVTGSFDGTVRVWDTRTGAALAVLKHPSWIGTAEFSPDGTEILTAAADHTVRRWDARTYQPLQRRADPADLLLPVPGEGQVVLEEPAPVGNAAVRETLKLACGLLRGRGQDEAAQRECSKLEEGRF